MRAYLWIGLALALVTPACGDDNPAVTPGAQGGGGEGGSAPELCPPGLLECSGLCVNAELDPAHCGDCDVACPAGASCVGGGCEPLACPAGLTACDGACTNLSFDPLHCGDCATACDEVDNASAVCASGNCAQLCQLPFGDCNASSVDGCETDTSQSVNHCGACGNACELAQATAGCQDGGCIVTGCDPGHGNCDGDEASGCETGDGEVDQQQTAYTGLSFTVSNAQAISQTLTVGLSGVLTDVAVIGENCAFPAGTLTLEVIGEAGSLGTASLAADAGCPGTIVFDLAGECIVVAADDVLTLRFSMTAPAGNCDVDQLDCIAGLVGNNCSEDFECEPRVGLSSGDNTPYTAGMVVDGGNTDLIFTTYVQPLP